MDTAWTWPQPPLPELFEPLPDLPPVGSDAQRHREVLDALDSLREALVNLPAPEVVVETTPGQAIPPGADPASISAAIRDALAPLLREGTQTTAEALSAVTDRLKTLSKQIVAASMGGGGASSNVGVRNQAGETLHVTVDSAPAATGTVSVSNFPATQAVTDNGGSLSVDDNGGSLTVDGSVSVANFPATQPVSGTFWQATQPVSLATNTPDVTDRSGRLLGHVTVDAAPTTAVTGPLTDTQLRASAVPVSGTFFQATQPVSLATNTPDVTDRAARLLGHVTVDNASVAVTGPLTDTQLRASAVPVSGTVTGNQGTANTVGNAWPVKNTDGTNTAAVKAASTAAAATDPALVISLSPNSALPTGTNSIGTTLGPTLTKSTQGSTGYSVQALIDAGRAVKGMLAAFTSTQAAETSISFQVSTDGGALAGAATSYTVTTGKRLRIQQVWASMRGGGTVPAVSFATLKMKVGSVQQGGSLTVVTPASATQSAAFPTLTFPDGYELAAGAVLSFTLTLSAWTTTTNTPIIDLGLIGFEY